MQLKIIGKSEEYVLTNTNIPQNSIENKKHSATVDYALMLIAPLFVAFFIHGVSAVKPVAISVLTCALTSFLGKKLIKSETSIKDISNIIIGVMVALLLPVNIPWWIVVLSSIFAVAVCVLPFGSFEKTPFIPAVAAISFATLCWPEFVFNYSDHGMSLAKMLTYGNAIDGNHVAILEIFIGNVPSAMGTGCIIALIGSLAFLLIRRTKDTIPVFSFILAACIMAFAFPRISSGRALSVVMELCSGMLLFCAIFFMSSPNYMPEKLLGKLAWGFTSGIICMLIRYVGAFEESIGFGILISCGISDYFDKLPYTRKEKLRIKASEPYTEIEISTVVPEEILNEIPDISIDTTETDENNLNEIILGDSESLDTVVSEENTLMEQEAPFIIGGDGDE
ncbi:MAG: RnfABCDGE type electron transport complex subunit D [Clostridia bacterium]|nr:RnfABCDGE type electron transport complex subunit D [Clostridia bacterium]